MIGVGRRHRRWHPRAAAEKSCILMAIAVRGPRNYREKLHYPSAVPIGEYEHARLEVLADLKRALTKEHDE